MSDTCDLKFPSGATLTTDGDKVTGRIAPTECIADLIAYALALATAVPAEPQRSPLPDSDAWRYTGKERDDFPGFTVNSIEAIDFTLPASRPAPKGSTLHAHPGKGSALLRG